MAVRLTSSRPNLAISVLGSAFLNLKFRSVLPGHESINGHFSLLAMEFQAESLNQKRLKHRPQLFFGRPVRRPGNDIVFA